ncbi:hypothetical protein B0J11DRAFT_582098 [Dendryphion nanum]|uniref:Uncharacterized protein n=1 Tax=Dendryphion nanum TaxID=256645 RepID=A0A9P9DI17_9PLEO|nr:hypothetical protein B0J11DRAFT_582098 [Dendryphion nanum]
MHQFTPDEENLLYVIRLVMKDYPASKREHTVTIYNRLVDEVDKRTFDGIDGKIKHLPVDKIRTRLGIDGVHRLRTAVEPVVQDVCISTTLINHHAATAPSTMPIFSDPLPLLQMLAMNPDQHMDNTAAFHPPFSTFQPIPNNAVTSPVFCSQFYVPPTYPLLTGANGLSMAITSPLLSMAQPYQNARFWPMDGAMDSAFGIEGHSMEAPMLGCVDSTSEYAHFDNEGYAKRAKVGTSHNLISTC